MPQPYPHSLGFRLFSALWVVLTTYTCLAAAQANRTVDDFSPLITYTPASDVTHFNTTGFDVSKLYNGTIGIMNATDVVNMTLKFTGTAIWLFLAKPETTDGFGEAYTIFVDGVDVNDVGEGSAVDDAEYADLAFSNETMPLGPHVITLSTSGIVYFDYAVFTSNDPTPETTIPPVHPLSSSASATGKAKNTANPPAPPSQSSAAAKKGTSHVAAIAGAAAGVILLLGAGVAVLLMRRRRTRPAMNAPQKQNYPGYGGGQPPYGGGQSGYGANPGALTSEAGLLRVPTHVSQYSSSHPGPQPMPPPLPDAQHQYQYQAQGQQFQQPYQAQQAQYPVQQQYPAQSQYDPQVQAHPQFSSPSQLPYHEPHSHQYQPQVQTQYSSAAVAQQQSYHDPHPQQAYHDPQPTQPHRLQDPFAYVQPHNAAMQRVMAEQRAVEAEYARPTAWIVDEKKEKEAPLVLERNTSQLAPSTATLSPSSPSWSGSVDAHAYPPSPNSYSSSPSPSRGTSTHGHVHGQGKVQGADPALSNIAAEMQALRAQVARLEGERGREDLPPPAYD
ncbi:hypothetical protein B0H19DRAFT_1374120 [Mycena capillaripes]|nr:hypothetical protein B0H19DRAFT_1374120 [Mycena capillaripes]